MTDLMELVAEANHVSKNAKTNINWFGPKAKSYVVLSRRQYDFQTPTMREYKLRRLYIFNMGAKKARISG